MKKTYHRWQDLRKKKLTPEQLEQIDREVEQELLEMDLRAIRELVGKTQEDVAAEIDMTQSEVSRLEPF
ncbi:MAG: helix-turn-helix transcriptional regulator [Deltaproteobacteria bacterium]|nr:helix-turn-helix transcriptional regulator [Deltaproteobacteria bacterium]